MEATISVAIIGAIAAIAAAYITARAKDKTLEEKTATQLEF